MESGQNKTQRFREQIRKKNLHDYFQKKRKEIDQSADFPTEHLHDEKMIASQIKQIQQQYHQNNGLLSLKNLKRLAILSQKIDCLSIMKNADFVGSLNNFMNEDYLDSQHQFYVSIILCNLFYIAAEGEIAVSSQFLLQIYHIILMSTKNKIKQNCLALIFHIVHDLDTNGLQSMIPFDPSRNLMSILSKLSLQGQLSQLIIKQILKIFYIFCQKLKYPRNQHFSKMRKIIFICILSAQNIEIFFLGVMALNSLLTCLPEECDFSNPNKSLVIARIMDKVTENLNNQTNLAINVRLARQLFSILGLTTQYVSGSFLLEKVFPFIYYILEKQSKIESESIAELSYSVLYKTLLTDRIDIQTFFINFNGVILLLIDSFQRIAVNPNQSVQLIYLIGLIYGRMYQRYAGDQKIGSLIQRVKLKMIELIENRALELEDKTLKFMEQTLKVCDKYD